MSTLPPSASPPPARVTTTTVGPTAPAFSRQRQILLLIFGVIVVAVVLRACFPGESRYERITHRLTEAIQNGDVAEVQKLENVGTAADMSRQRLGGATDALAPLGKIKGVKEVTDNSLPPRVHKFNVTFEKGADVETIEFDPQDKVFHFHYAAPVRNP